jgi:hypothetical protein
MTINTWAWVSAVVLCGPVARLCGRVLVGVWVGLGTGSLVKAATGRVGRRWAVGAGRGAATIGSQDRFTPPKNCPFTFPGYGVTIPSTGANGAPDRTLTRY